MTEGGGSGAAADRQTVQGVAVDPHGRCAHWHGESDIVAIRLPCCDRYFACHDCHLEVADHPPRRWGRDDFHRVAVLCGACGAELTIRRYLDAPGGCPVCGTAFNPRCVLHHPLYFE